MENHNSSNVFFGKEHSEDRQKKGQELSLNPKFDLDRFNNAEGGITKNDIQAEAKKLVQQSQEAINADRFPVDVFPLRIQNAINATNASLNYPIDFISASMLYAVSVATGNSHKVEIKKSWQESAVLYMAIVGRAGTNKSHPLSFAIQPIVEHDKKTYKDYEHKKQEFDYASSLTKKERDQQGIDDPIKPVWNKCLLSDFTPEALAEVHKFNRRGIGVYADELISWIKNLNRYNNGSEEQFWLSVFSGKPINIDRKSGDPVFIPSPFISVAGTIQNGVLNELAKNRTENGFLDRILFVVPDNVKKTCWSETDLDPLVLDNWHTVISNILNIEIEYDDTGNPKPKILKFTPEAKLVLFFWQKKNTDQCNEADDEVLSGIYSKLEIYASRLALILEMMRFACDGIPLESISLESIQGALKLVEYFKRSALKVNEIISNRNPRNILPEDKQALYKALPQSFKTSEGVEISTTLGMPERTFKNFIKDQNLFKNLKYGEYEKLF
jgi:hypothetical protein